jgi:3-phosphoshikimate 1-carboxyvinyltransferase
MEMTLPPVMEVQPADGPLMPGRPLHVPGSKSITNRALILAALAEGQSKLNGVLWSDDSRRMLECLDALGFDLEANEEAKSVHLWGSGGKVPGGQALKAGKPLFVGNAGTAARFLPVLAALGSGKFQFTADPRMSQRPMAGLLENLQTQGAKVSALNYPFELEAKGLAGGQADVDLSASSQFASGLLMAGPFMKKPLVLRLKGRTELPYVEMTAEMVRRFGGQVRQEGSLFEVALGGYNGREYAVEPDLSSASYLFAAGALLGGKVTVAGLSSNSLQGDIRFLGVLKHMGCRFYEDPISQVEEGLTLERDPGEPLQGVDVDMGAFSDQALTLAALAPFCASPTTLRNIGHIRKQECDRLEAITSNLGRLGVKTELLDDGNAVRIHPGPMRGTELETYKDHRVAMAFALVGLKVPGVKIKDPACVSKTFENYWEVLGQLTGNV